MRKLGIGLALAALATWAVGCGGGHGGGRDASTAVCGDTVREDGEACDDGNDINGDGCDNNCTLTRCGNGIPTTATGEACDDGNETNGDGCDRNCTVSACGNGVVAGDEECDDDTDACTDDCRRTCGNGQLEPNEQCDDGNTSDGDGCDTNCTFSFCGNGIRAGAEACDDGNPIDDDGCDVNCQPSGCGNGVKSAREQCDDGDVTNDDGCDGNCTFTGCGNGVQGDGEVCDDGNVTNGDGCDANCTLSSCGNGALDETTEACDDGNVTPGDGCSPSCAIERCGDGVTNTRTGIVAYAFRFTSSTSAPYAIEVNGTRVLEGVVQSGACDGAPTTTASVDDAARIAALTPTANALRVIGSAPGSIGRVYVVFTYDVDGDGAADVTDEALAIDGAGCADDDDCCLPIASAGAAATGTFDSPVEGCDDGRNGDDYDGCTDACVVGTCGNGLDDDPDTAPEGVPLTGCEVDLDPACDLNCTKPRCGNGVVGLDEDGLTEACDDGDLVSGDGCSASCEIEAGFTCPGSGAIGSGAGDAGAPAPSEPGALGGPCVAICGDGVVQAAELCDDGNGVNGDACDIDCIPRGRCGDGVPNGYDDPATAEDESEACDDGNAMDGDGCDTNCTLTGCGNGIRTGSEACDDGDRANDDGCDVKCRVNLCNDGVTSIGELCFGLPATRPLVFSARAMAAARIDRGLSVDLATANGGDETFAIALNDGNGVFTAREYWVGFGADVADLALADFDGNGLVDVAVIDASGGYVQVRYNAGNGTFYPGTSYAVGQGPVRLVAADLDGDGDPDLAAVNAGTNDVSVLLDLGPGGFAEAVAFPVPAGPRDLGAGDVDHDGHADLVVAGTAGRLQVLPGNGAGSFAIGAGLDLGAEVGEVELADLNRDGAADVVLGFTSGPAPLGVLLSSRGGSLDLSGLVAHAGFDAPRALGLADLDGDGDADVLALGDRGRLTILRNNGAGAFGAAIGIFEAGVGATDVVATDLNGDSVRDLASVAGRAIEVMISTP